MCDPLEIPAAGPNVSSHLTSVGDLRGWIVATNGIELLWALESVDESPIPSDLHGDACLCPVDVATVVRACGFVCLFDVEAGYVARRPVRLQQSRRKGAKARPGSKYVGRPGPFGNIARVVPCAGGWTVQVADATPLQLVPPLSKEKAAEFAVGLHRPLVYAILGMNPAKYMPLRGRDLRCWCPPGQACHGDTLVELVNAPFSELAEGSSSTEMLAARFVAALPVLSAA